MMLGSFLSVSFAQPKQGNYVIGGSTGFNFNKAANSLSNNYGSSFRIDPQVGKFMSDKFLLEGGLGYSLDHGRTNNNVLLSKNTSHSISGNIELTRFLPVADKLYFTLGAYINSSYGLSKSIWETFGSITTNQSNTVRAGIGITPGLAYFLNEQWMIYSNIGALGYDLTYFDSSGLTSHDVGYSFAANPFSIGVRYILDPSRKKK